jgi:hypothetical protein
VPVPEICQISHKLATLDWNCMNSYQRIYERVRQSIPKLIIYYNFFLTADATDRPRLPLEKCGNYSSTNENISHNSA